MCRLCNKPNCRAAPPPPPPSSAPALPPATPSPRRATISSRLPPSALSAPQGAILVLLQLRSELRTMRTQGLEAFGAVESLVVQQGRGSVMSLLDAERRSLFAELDAIERDLNDRLHLMLLSYHTRQFNAAAFLTVAHGSQAARRIEPAQPPTPTPPPSQEE